MPQKPLLKANKKLEKKQAANRHGKTPKTKKGELIISRRRAVQQVWPSRADVDVQLKRPSRRRHADAPHCPCALLHVMVLYFGPCNLKIF
jgi:hypothetical protein